MGTGGSVEIPAGPDPGVGQTCSPEYRKIVNWVMCQNVFPNGRYIHGCGTTSETSRQDRLAAEGGHEAWQPSTMRR